WNENNVRGVVMLGNGQVDARAWLFANGPVLAVLHYADDLGRLPSTFEPDLPADGLLPRPVLLGHLFIDDGHARSRFIVAQGEGSPFEDRYIQSLEVVGRASIRNRVHRL